MTAPQRLIGIDDVTAGNRLARDLLDDRSQVLMPAGAELTDSSLLSLRRRDVQELWVVDDSVPTPDPHLAQVAQREHHRARLARLFRKLDTGAAEPGRLLTLMRRYRGLKP